MKILAILLLLSLLGCRVNNHYRPGEIPAGAHVYTVVFISMGDSKEKAANRGRQEINSVGIPYHIIEETDSKYDSVWLDRMEIEFLVPNDDFEEPEAPVQHNIPTS